MGSVADDRWHVRMAPGEVKVLTLEQIDDLFRLEMIDGETLVRQDGTEQRFAIEQVRSLSWLSDNYVQARARDASYAIRIDAGHERAFELPEIP